MPAAFENQYYDLIEADFGGYKQSIVAPKIRFQAAAGYVHQRERYPAQARKIVIESARATEGERNMMRAWLVYMGSGTFWYVLPASLAPRPDGQVIPRGVLCRVIDEEIPDEPVGYGDGPYYHLRVTLESIGGEVE